MPFYDHDMTPSSVTKPKIIFDHFYVVLSPEDYALIKSDPVFHRFFGSTYERTVKTGEGNEWTGFYANALDHRYIEFFYEGPRVDEGYVRGAAGIGLCSEKIGFTSDLDAYYRQHCPGRNLTILERTLNSTKLNRVIPWFTALSTTPLETPFLKTWAMDYQRDFIQSSPTFRMKDDDHLDRDYYGFKDPDPSDSQPKIKRIQSLTLACRESEMEQYRQDLIDLTFELQENSCFELNGFTLRLTPAQSVQNRVIEVQFELDREVKDFSHSMGSGWLVGDGVGLFWRALP